MEGDERHGRDGASTKPTVSRTKSSVRRERELKQLERVEVLDTEADEGFNLIERKAKNSAKAAAATTPTQETQKTPKKARQSTPAEGEKASRSLTFSKRGDVNSSRADHSSAAAGSTAQRVRVPARRIGADTFSSSSPALASAPAISRNPRSSTSLVQPKPKKVISGGGGGGGGGGVTTPPLESQKDPKEALSAQNEELQQELEDARLALKQARGAAEAVEEERAKEKEGWVRESEGMEEAQREAETARKLLETQCDQLQKEALRLSSAETERGKEASRTGELEVQLASTIERENKQITLRVATEEKFAALQTQLAAAVQGTHTAQARATCLVLSHQELAKAAERDRLLHMADKEELQASEARLTALVESLTHNMKREQGVSQDALRSLETLEARSKRMEAEKVRLEQLQDLPQTGSFEGTNPTSPPSDQAATDELWAHLHELEAAKRDAEASKEAEVRKLQQTIDTAHADKEALWQECERLSKQVESLQATPPDTSAVSDLQAQLAAAQATIVSQESSKAADSQALWQECDTLAQKVGTLQADLVVKAEDAAELQDCLETARSELAAVETTLRAEVAAREAQGVQLQEMETERVALADQVAILQTELKAAERTESVPAAVPPPSSSSLALLGSPASTYECTSLDQSNDSIERQQQQHDTSVHSSPVRKEAAPARSNALNGEPTRFGFIPFKLMSGDSGQSASRRTSLQQARMARKSDTTGTTQRTAQPRRSFDSIIGDIDAMKRTNSSSTPTTPHTPGRDG